MKENIVIIGAGGHGKVCAEIARLNGYAEIAFLDDNPNTVGICGTTKDLLKYVDAYDVFVAIGDNATRKKLYHQARALRATMATLVHPQSVVSEAAVIGEGSAVMAGAIVNPNAKIGVGCIVNTCSSVDHDCAIGDFTHIAVGAHLAGGITVNDETMIGAGATIINNLYICKSSIIGAGATVIKNVDELGTYVGVPARRIK